MNTCLSSLAILFVLSLAHQVTSEESLAADAKEKSQPLNHVSELSRTKRSNVDMFRLARGLHMLRLGKRSMPVFRQEPEVPSLDDFLDALENGYYYDEDYNIPPPSVSTHYRFKRDTNQQAPAKVEVPATPENNGIEDEQNDKYFYYPDDKYFDENSEDDDAETVKRSLHMLRLGRSGEFPQESYVDGQSEELDAEKRPMNMLRLGKRPMNMLRLGKRPMNMLRLGKRPMNMLRLGKRPMNMLRLGKRPMNMLRLGKREEDDVNEENINDQSSEEDIEEVKRPLDMLRLGKRQLNMLRLGKRPMNMLRLGKRPMNMLRLGKRPMNMLRLGKRDTE